MMQPRTVGRPRFLRGKGGLAAGRLMVTAAILLALLTAHSPVIASRVGSEGLALGATSRAPVTAFGAATSLPATSLPGAGTIQVLAGGATFDTTGESRYSAPDGGEATSAVSLSVSAMEPGGPMYRPAPPAQMLPESAQAPPATSASPAQDALDPALAARAAATAQEPPDPPGIDDPPTIADPPGIDDPPTIADPPAIEVPASIADAPAMADSPAPVAPVVPATAESLVTGRAMYTTDSVNLRQARGTDGTIVIRVLNGGQSLTAGDTVDGWVPVHAGDTYGWVSSDYLADGTPPNEAPPAPPANASAGNWMTDLLPQVDPGGAANWEFWRNGAWGATDGHTVYIDPNVPPSKRFSVMVHEYSHVLQVQVYGSLGESVAEMSALIGGSRSDVTANESTADCMALMLGATWANYGCRDSLRSAASAILAGNRP